MSKDYYLVTLSGVDTDIKVLCTKKNTVGNFIESMRSIGTYIYYSKGFVFEEVYTKKLIFSDFVRDETIGGRGTRPNEKALGHLTYKLDSQYIPSNDELEEYIKDVLGTEEKRDSYTVMLNEIENKAILEKKSRKHVSNTFDETFHKPTRNKF